MTDATNWPERISDSAIRNTQRTGPVLAGLVDINDPDWSAWQTDDAEFYLRAAGRAIRRFCSWHLFPNIRQHVEKITPGADGLVMLPSRYVTEVDRLTISHGQHEQEIRRGAYEWFEAGYIQLRGGFWDDWQAAGYYGPDQYWLPLTRPGIAAVTMWSGYNTLPEDVKIVAFELAEQARIAKAGNVKMLATPGEYRLEPSQDFGLTLNKDQENRLSSYRLGMVG